MGTFGLLWRIATGPVWILWSGYKGLWWVFGDTHEPVAKSASKNAAAPAQDASFQVVDSGPKSLPTPVRALRGGFVGTLMASGGLLFATNAMAATSVVTPDRGIAAWLWGTAIVAVTSIFMVRRAVRLDRNRKGFASVIRGAKSAAGKAAGACGWAAQRAVQCAASGARQTVQAGAERAREINQRHGVAQKARDQVKQKAGSAWNSARRLWNSIGRGTSRPQPATRTAA
jgi:hypothetical protein